MVDHIKRIPFKPDIAPNFQFGLSLARRSGAGAIRVCRLPQAGRRACIVRSRAGCSRRRVR
jgi:hypothetical protein